MEVHREDLLRSMGLYRISFNIQIAKLNALKYVKLNNKNATYRLISMSFCDENIFVIL